MIPEKFNMRRLIYGIFFVVLTVVATVASAAQTPAEVRVLIMGDSLSAAYNMPIEQGWVSLLQQRATQAYPGTRVINASVSGETAENAVRRLPALIKQHTPDVIVIELGANDGFRGFKLEQIRKSLQTLIDLAQAAGAEIVLTGIQLHPNYGAKFNQRFLDSYRQLAQQNKTHLVPLIIKGIGDNPLKMQADGTHPTAAAQLEVLENMWPAIKAAIESVKAGANQTAEAGRLG
jgi:acyl-CoA thioesterase-1